ncbi:MAG: type 4a pilus biogenesis protein PilO, partial [Actinomycetota bacterium]|nr:type 4a pilus biogenesis protein PilO [Actinomycetota bacterium]
MDKLNQWIALTVVGCLAVLAGGWFLLVAPQRAEAEALRAQAAAQDGTNSTLRTKLAVLKAQAKDLPKKQAELAAVAAKIPGGPELPALIRALDAASADAGVDLMTIAPGAPVPVGAAADGAAPAAPAGAAAAA